MVCNFFRFYVARVVLILEWYSNCFELRTFGYEYLSVQFCLHAIVVCVFVYAPLTSPALQHKLKTLIQSLQFFIKQTKQQCQVQMITTVYQIIYIYIYIYMCVYMQKGKHTKHTADKRVN